MPDVLVGVYELEVALLDVLFGPVEFLQLTVILPLVLRLDANVLVVEEGVVVVQLVYLR